MSTSFHTNATSTVRQLHFTFGADNIVSFPGTGFECKAWVGPETRALIETTLVRLRKAKLPVDPLARDLLPANGFVNSLIKREGHVLQCALSECLSANDRYLVWTGESFSVSKEADLLVRNGSEKACLASSLPYGINTSRKIELDLIVFDRHHHTLRAYEIKRGSGKLDGGKTRSTRHDLLCARTLLQSYGSTMGVQAATAETFAVIYYGRCSLPRSLTLTKDNLDEHFGMPIQEHVDAALQLYRLKAGELMESMGNDVAWEGPSC